MKNRMIDDDDRYAGIRSTIVGLIAGVREKRDQAKTDRDGITWEFETIDGCIVQCSLLPKENIADKTENIVISVIRKTRAGQRNG